MKTHSVPKLLLASTLGLLINTANADADTCYDFATGAQSEEALVEHALNFGACDDRSAAANSAADGPEWLVLADDNSLSATNHPPARH